MANKKKKKVNRSKQNNNTNKKTANTSAKKNTNTRKKTTNTKKTNTNKKTSTSKNTVVKEIVETKIEEQKIENEVVDVPKKNIKVLTPKEELKEVIDATTKETSKKLKPKQQSFYFNDINENDDIEVKEKSKIKIYTLSFTIALIAIILFLVGYSIYKDRNEKEIEFGKIKFDKYLELYSNPTTDLNYIFISSNSCIICDKYEEKLDKLRSEYKIDINKLDVSNLNDTDLEKLKDSSIFITNIDEPIFISIKDGKVINGVVGDKEYSALKNFVDYSNNPSTNSFTSISINKYMSLLNSNEPIVIYICESKDKVCAEFQQTLELVSSRKNIKIYYLNTEEMLTEDDWNKLNESLGDMWFKPATIIVKDGKIKDYKMENMTEEDLTKFFDKNNL